ncbi:TonB-dependent receptor [Bacteroidota bacterium]
MKNLLKNKVFLPNKDLIKILITMKFASLLLFLSTFQILGSVYSQGTRLTFDLKNASVIDVFNSIEDQSEFKFLYHEALVNSEKSIDLKANENTVEEILNDVFANSENTFTVLENNLIVIKPKGGTSNQEIKITGKVMADKGNVTLPGVNIIIKGTDVGTVSDLDGNFSITAPSSESVLVFSFVGYEPQEIIVGEQTTINITLIESIKTLDEIVVIGYGSVKKRELTGSVLSMKEEDFNQGAFSDPMQLIQGKVAGLSIVRTNGGDPTSGYELLLRGSSSVQASLEPLVVIDGIPGGSLDAISPEDVESIDILKDGSAAAIYGTRGTNGVILVTTKKGQKGALQVEFSSRYFTERVSNKIEVLSAAEFLATKEEWATSDNEVKVEKSGNMIDYGYDTDWFEEIIRNPFSHNQHLALSGGSENNSYRVSFDYLDQEGILLESSKQEYKIGLNMQQSALNDKLKFNSQLGMATNNYHPVDYNAVRQTIQRNPTEPVYNDDGTLFEAEGSWQYENPVGLLIERTNDNKVNRYYVNLGADVYITEALKVGALVGVHVGDSINGHYTPSYAFTQEVQGTYGYAKREMAAKSTKTFESTIEWKKQFSEHHINLLGGYSYQDFMYESFEADNTNFITDDVAYNYLGLGTYLTEGRASMDSYKKESKLIAFFARGAYNFRGKYFLSASVRREGSSKFGKNNKWGTFPAVSAAWDLSSEDFLGDLNLELLKVRVGYGVTGNEGLEDPYIPLVRYGLEGRFLYEGAYLQGFGPISNENPDLKWETKHEINIGIDWMILNSRLGGTIDLYRRDTKDLLEEYEVPTPPNLFASTWQNVGSLRNTGIEFGINTVPVKKEDFTWNVNFNFEYRKNVLLSLSNDYYTLERRTLGDIGPPGVEAWTHMYEVDEPLGNIHGYVFEGLDSVGGWIFKDYDPIADTSDGEITVDDRDVIGNGIPDFYLGLSTTLRYKDFDLTIVCRGMFGQQIINAKSIWHNNPYFLPANVMKTALDEEVWDTPDFSSYYVEDGDFIKFDNITLGYNLPIKNSEWIKSGRIYITGNNLFLITSYSGVDPEVSIQGLEPGNDNRFDYPSTRTFMVGFNVKF